jgi:hypothetical protein
MVHVPIDYTDVPLDDSGPEGTFRCKVVKPTMYPDDPSKIDMQTMMLPGETTDDGDQRYASMQVMFEHLEHPSSEQVGGESLAGEQFSEMYSFSPKMFNKKKIRELIEATGCPHGVDGVDFSAMIGSVVDVVRKNKKDRDTKKLKSRVTAVNPVIE